MTDSADRSEPTEDFERAANKRRKRYKKSLNLPKTSFPMRANLHQNEPQSLKRWQKIGLYERVQKARSNDPPFVFHDGPPYANGPIHVGHLLNKVLKDLVVRTRTMSGRNCSYVPGWDCHGLPIEHRVMTEMIESGKVDKLNALPEDTRRMAIRRECAAYANKYKKLQASQMKRLMTLADYEDPYLTMAREYEREVLGVFADLLEQGLVYRALKPVHWSIANQTALAEAELEYYDRKDPSIYVWFEATDPGALAECFGLPVDSLSDQPGFMIWTTTPWTLPANLLVAVHERNDYSLVRLGDRVGVIATARVDAVAAEGGLESSTIETLGRANGRQLLGLGYRHPFRSDAPAGAWRIVAAEYVTLEDGTGLVHTAPGHGAEDYGTGMKQGLPAYCPVQEDGCYDDSVPEWLRGQSIWDANPVIVDRLQESGHLYHHHDFTHSYPHDWRSKTPVIFRATEQWFIAVDKETVKHGRSLREAALSATDGEIRFIPEWGKNRMRGMLESRPDWCLSRQRCWGLPIPAFRTESGDILLSPASVRAVASVVGERGSDAWFGLSPGELLANYNPEQDPLAPANLELEGLSKFYDILDVWFESGSSWNAVVRARDLGFPTDLYLEGSDQHRGWFQSSLLTALGVTDKPPYRALLTHGFMVDKDGRKMSKSLGNTLGVDDLLQDFGADVCRWWVSSLAFENDIKVGREVFELAGESYRKVRNTLRFLLSNLEDFEPSDSAPAALPLTLDAWALGQAEQLRAGVVAAYEAYDFRQAHLLLFDFCNDTLSSVYLDAMKDRLYCDPADSERRRSTQQVLYELTFLLCDLLAPIIPHTADEAYRALVGASDEEDTVHTHTYRKVVGPADARWEHVFEVRSEIKKALEDSKERGLENSLDAGVAIADPDGELADFLPELPDLFGVSRVQLLPENRENETIDLRDQPRCERSWRRDETVKQRSDGGWLSDRDAFAVGIE